MDSSSSSSTEEDPQTTKRISKRTKKPVDRFNPGNFKDKKQQGTTRETGREGGASTSSSVNQNDSAAGAVGNSQSFMGRVIAAMTPSFGGRRSSVASSATRRKRAEAEFLKITSDLKVELRDLQRRKEEKDMDIKRKEIDVAKATRSLQKDSTNEILKEQLTERQDELVDLKMDLELFMPGYKAQHGNLKQKLEELGVDYEVSLAELDEEDEQYLGSDEEKVAEFDNKASASSTKEVQFERTSEKDRIDDVEEIEQLTDRLTKLKTVEVGQRNPLLAHTHASAVPNSHSSSPSTASSVHQDQMSQMTQAITMIAESMKGSKEKDDKVMARQGKLRDLPFFSGKPEEWPAFLEEYQSSTEECGYSNVTNLQRLRKALKGEAKAKVEVIMIKSESVPEVMKILKKAFGQPKHIVMAMIKKAKMVPAVSANNPQSLIDFATGVVNLVTVIETLDCHAHLSNPQLLEDLLSKLPVPLRIKWIEWKNGDVRRTEDLSCFKTWIEQESDTATEIVELKVKEDKKDDRPQKQDRRRNQGSVHAVDSQNRRMCNICGKTNHRTHQCFALIKATPDERLDKVDEKKLCRMCLQPGHFVRDCQSKFPCAEGKSEEHNVVLHGGKPKFVRTRRNDNATTRNDNGGGEEHTVTAIANVNQISTGVPNFRYVMVEVEGPKGKKEVLAMFDEGCDVCLCEEEIVNAVGAVGPRSYLGLNGYGGSKKEYSQTVEMKLRRPGQREYYQVKGIRTVKDLGLKPATLNVDSIRRKYPHLRNIPLQSYQGVRPKMLIGGSHYFLTYPLKVVWGRRGQPTATKSRLGWSIMDTDSRKIERGGVYCITCEWQDEELHQLVKGSFALDGSGLQQQETEMSKEDVKAIKIFDETAVRVPGKPHFEMTFPWRDPEKQLPPSRTMALQRLQTMERKMDRDSGFAEAYCKKIEEYKDKEYISEVIPGEHQGKVWYLPHFGVYNPNKPGKLRLVFDAKSLGASLNDCLLQGPDLNKSLVSVFMTFRQYEVAIVGTILEKSEVGEWRYVPTKLNVADDGTRDNKETDFDPKGRWFKGEKFLYQGEAEWPQDPLIETVEEEDEIEMVRVNTISSEDVFPIKFGSYLRQVRVTAWILRYLRNLKIKADTRKNREVKKLVVGSGDVGSVEIRTNLGKSSKQSKRVSVQPLTKDEFVGAEGYWWRRSQEESYPEEWGLLHGGKPVPKKSVLFKLSPLLGEDGVIRMDGRLRNARCLPEETRSPVILHSRHPYTKLLIMREHEKCGHQGKRTAESELQKRFWIVGLTSGVKRAFRECQWCKVRKAKPVVPEMGQLPWTRVQPHVRPFTNTGLDYFGPMEVVIGRRREKRWGALFTCLSTRAVHVELANSLTTDSCINAIRRFSARRGVPENIFSDNGTNFHGSNNELKKALRELDQEALYEQLNIKGIKWHFNPPAAPHMGGVWERLVGSVHKVLGNMLEGEAYPEETLHTFLCEAESILNKRPLTEVSMDPNDPEPLTPEHFLLLWQSGKEEKLKNEVLGEFDKGDKLKKKSWRAAQRLADEFWVQWITRYLPTLSRREKWHNTSTPVKVGDVVVIVDNQVKRNQWLKGIVEEVVVSKVDGKIRHVNVRTKDSVYRRAVAKIAVIDVNPHDNTSKVG